MENPVSRFRTLKKQIAALLQDGLAPERIALAVTLGFCLALIPLPFTNTLFLFLLAIWLRLNHVLIQTINYLLFPFQVLLYLPFYRLGAHITGIHVSGSVNFLSAGSLKEIAGVGGEFFLTALIAWAIVMVILGPVLYLALIRLLNPAQQRSLRLQHLYITASRKMRLALSGIFRNFRDED